MATQIIFDKLYYYCNSNNDQIPCIVRKHEHGKWYVEIFRVDLGITYVILIHDISFNTAHLIPISSKKIITKMRLKGLVE